MISVILWGIGKIYSQHVNVLKYFESIRQLKVIGLTDQTIKERGGRLDEFEILPVKAALSLNFDAIIVMSDKWYKDILNDIRNCGVDEARVIPCRVLDVPGIDMEEYFALKMQGVSIISNNCWGGLVYCTLGMECLSPLKNLFLEDDDYIKLISNLDNYFSCTPEVGYETVDINSGKKYPVLKLKDIFIHCNHSDGFDEAISNWVRRCKKVEWSHLFFEMYSDNVATMESFAKICQDRAYIGFTDKKCNISIRNIETLTIPKNGKLWEEVLGTASVAGGYDLVALLTKGVIRKRGRN